MFLLINMKVTVGVILAFKHYLTSLVLSNSSLVGHFLIASGDDHTSIFVPPKEVATSPSGTLRELYRFIPKNQQVAEKYTHEPFTAAVR